MQTTQNIIRPKTGAYSVLASECAGGYVFTNEGAGALVAFTLPSAVANYKVSFVIQNAFGLSITPAGGDTINGGGVVSYTTVGDVIELTCINSTEWIASIVGGSTSNLIAVRARKSGTQTILQTSNMQLVTFAGTDDFDTDNMHNPAVNNERITINTAGIYNIGASLVTNNTNNSSGSGGFQALLRLNGTTFIGGGTVGSNYSNGADTNGFFAGTAMTTYEFQIGDYVEVLVGGQFSLNADLNSDSAFWATKIS